MAGPLKKVLVMRKSDRIILRGIAIYPYAT